MVCRGNRFARFGGKAHSAFLNCSPNDRRASARPRPPFRQQTSGTNQTFEGGFANARVSTRRHEESAGETKGGRGRPLALASEPLAKIAAVTDGDFGRHGAPTIVGGRTVAGVAGCARLPGARASPNWRARLGRTGVRQPFGTAVPSIVLGCAETVRAHRARGRRSRLGASGVCPRANKDGHPEGGRRMC